VRREQCESSACGAIGGSDFGVSEANKRPTDRTVASVDAARSRIKLIKDSRSNILAHRALPALLSGLWEEGLHVEAVAAKDHAL